MTLKLKPSKLRSSKVNTILTILRDDNPWSEVLADCGGFEFLCVIEDGQILSERFFPVNLEENAERLEFLSRNVRVFCVWRFVRQKFEEVDKMIFYKVQNKNLFVTNI